MADLNERGKTGLAQWAGIVSEAYNAKLEWPAAYAIADEMRRRDPAIRAMLNAQNLLARTASWYFEPGGQGEDDKRGVEFLETSIHDMSITIEDAIEDALSCVWFGWSWQEICYKRRQGTRGSRSSRYDDGLIGWQKWAERRQSSFARWEFDEGGGVQAMVQRAAPDYTSISLPVEKALHFRGMRDGGNPEGWGLYESLYETWYFLKNLHILSGIGWERSFVGLPVFEVEKTITPEGEATIKRVGGALLAGEKQYVLVPGGVKFHLETVSNTSAEALLNQIKYERRCMFQTLLADFLDLGTGQTGSWALGQDKSLLFLMAVDGTLDRIAQVINRFAVPRLIEANRQAFAGISEVPQLRHKRVEKPAMGQVGAFLAQVGQMLEWTALDEHWLRERMGMPVVEISEQGRDEEDTGGETGTDDERPDPDEEGVEDRQLAEFAAPETLPDEARAEIEANIDAAVGTFLREEYQRVLDAAPGNQGLADDNAFWEAEAALMVAVLLPVLARALNRAGAAVAPTIDIGVEWGTNNIEALRWVREYAYELVTELTGTQRGALREAMGAWYELPEPHDLDTLRELLEPTFGAPRARAIAVTETTRANAQAFGTLAGEVGVEVTFSPPSRTNCRCGQGMLALPDGTPVAVWLTANDEIVSGRKGRGRTLSTPWGMVAGCDWALHRVIISAGPYQGRVFDDVVAEMGTQ